MAIKQAKVRHVLALPYPAQGHINPMLQLCQQLVSRGFTITFINTHHIHQRIMRASKALSSDEIKGAYYHNGCHSIRMVSVDGGSPPELHARRAGSAEAYRAAAQMQGPVEDLLATFFADQGPHVDFILSDILMGWSHATARKFGLPRVAFWPAAGATFSALLHFADLALECKDIRDVESKGLIHGIPGLPPTDLHDVPKVWDEAGCFLQFSRDILLPQVRETQEASYLLLNTFSELEGPVLDALSCRVPTLSVGPLLPTYNTEGEVKPLPRLSLFSEDDTCLCWLDKQKPSSVLFTSFGSISVRSEEQIQELAMGLEASHCAFLWVHRPELDAYHDTNGTSKNGTAGHVSILEALSEETQCRGLVVPWAPQLQVLSHPSVGGFVTHCGWNSVMESVSMGVPMLCWADTGERMSNQRFVVEIWKCGMAMVSDCRRHNQHIDRAVLITREEVETAVRSLMREDIGGSCRRRAAQLKDAAHVALQYSCARLDEFAQAMKQHLT